MSFHDDISLDHDEVQHLVRLVLLSAVSIMAGVVTVVTALVVSLR